MFKQNDRGRTAPGRFYLAGPNMAKGIKQNGLWPGHPRRTIPFARLKGWWRRGAGLALVMGLLQATGQGNVVINEIHYDPDIKTEPVEFVGDGDEMARRVAGGRAVAGQGGLRRAEQGQ